MCHAISLLYPFPHTDYPILFPACPYLLTLSCLPLFPHFFLLTIFPSSLSHVWGFSSSRYFEYLSTWIYDISLYIGVPHKNIPFIFLDTWGSFLQYSKYHIMCSLKYWNLKWILHHVTRNILLYVFRNILLWELLYICSQNYNIGQ